ncbi:MULTISPECIES: hypothetical protein [unclassified Arthrobacter]|uniref:hypothetical protein n=1 Tax=unclassified Arthrobacter TaxID=235627 RepID=UPI001D5ED462|nr:hypothetical protein [Arthrobacter sp. Bi26]CAH0238926.1 hypothetical protein SRABI26_02845 [Arthrobacter sp. Bi26]
MFRVEKTEDNLVPRVADADAGVYLEWLVTGSPYTTEVFELLNASGGIPFTTSREHVVDPESGLKFTLFKFITFGSAPRAQSRAKHLVNRTFDDDNEKQYWMKIAVEALLVFGTAFNGLEAPYKGFTRVEFNNRIYTLEHFGYTLGK